jgi:hypothetical protein
MRCFNHPDSEAVGTCKHCFKGICRECVKDSGHGIACSLQCMDEIKSLYEVLNRNKQMYSIAAKTHSRNAIWLGLLAAGFIAFGLWIKNDIVFAVYLFGMGALFVVGATFSFLNSRKMVRMSISGTANPAPKSPM